MTDKKDDWKEIAEHYYHVAVWFATNVPGTPVPDWCFMCWPIDTELLVDELIPLRQGELGI